MHGVEGPVSDYSQREWKDSTSRKVKVKISGRSQEWPQKVKPERWENNHFKTENWKVQRNSSFGDKDGFEWTEGHTMKIFHQQAEPMELRGEATCRHINVKRWDKAIRANEVLNYSIQRVGPGFRTKLFLSCSLGQEEKIGIEKNGKKKKWNSMRTKRV